MVFIVAGRPRRLAFCLLWPLLLAALCVGRNKIGFESETRPNENVVDPIVSISAAPPLTTAGGTASYTVTTPKGNNFRVKRTAAHERHYTVDGASRKLLVPAGAGSASVTVTALNGDLPAGHRVATTMAQKGGGYRLGSVAKPSGTIADPSISPVTVASAALDATPSSTPLATATPTPTATPASSPTQDIWIAVRTDGQPGSGTQADPYDGSTPEKFDTILYNYYFTPNLGVHLMGIGPFRTYANHVWAVQPGWVISGDGMNVTTIQMVGNVAGMRVDVDVFKSDPNVATDNATIKDLTVDCNWAELALTADEGLGSRSVTDAIVTQDSAVISSSTAVFTNEDYAKTLIGAGIPAGTIILSIQDAQHATMSVNATTTGTGLSVTIGGEKNIKTGAIILWGSNNLVDHVRCINSYGSLANNMEVFVIEMAASRSENGTNNVVQYCRVEHPQGNHGAPYALFGWPGSPAFLITNSRVIQCAAIGNAGGFSWSDPSIGFPSGGVNFGNVSNCQIDSNTFVDCEGAAYIDTGSCDGLSVTNNTVIRGQLGVGICNGAQPKRKIEISGNNFLIQNRRIEGASYGIASGFGAATDVTVCNNTVTFDTSGNGLLSFWGIWVGDVNNALICNNVVGPLNGTISNTAVGTDVILSNNRQPDGTPIPGL